MSPTHSRRSRNPVEVGASLLGLGVALAMVVCSDVRADQCEGAQMAYSYAQANEQPVWVHYVGAPFEKVGRDVKDWTPLLDRAYVVEATKGYRSIHWQQPSVSLQLQDARTTINFNVNIVTNRQMLTRIETTSTTLLKNMGIPSSLLVESAPAFWCVCGDATCNTLRIKRDASGLMQGVWTIGWD